MAARRAASRTRVNSTMAPPSSSRPRSVMAQHTDLAASAIAQRPPKSQQQDDSETNIQVVIRCRRRSEREIQDNSPIIVTSSGPKSHEVTIETSTPVSSLGVVTLPPTRTYPFDLVFGPEADQALIYHDVVAPMLAEVLQGYNCTLFAYGQTGTGKTYTMQGDLTPTPMGNPSAQAGMIPRVLFRLFHELESSGTDYSVKISFVELYNEELRDLLANELSAPIGTIQPMGQGSGASKDAAAQNGLKIFDDSNKRGVFIQGLEEVCVKDSADALQLLTKGSLRRQIAATKFNDHSSRSHSVFSITVHIKETSSIGDDLLKIGKLNLVDLAGSENIGRSGAENKRAREAGMINQSLLTLGRVINALVDRSQHVPYRESKLTRLLQDSLGGRTKTCIIATVSPARSNMEETLSTLDYAIRAKSIRNKPEVNQRMTRNALLKEYVAEIERLKADVLAAREKNGIFFSEETWAQLTAEQELRQTEFQEAKKQVEIVESQMRAVREEFEQSIALLMRRDGELKMTKEQLKAAEGELVAKEEELVAVKGALEEEVVVRQAHQETETVLNDVASDLKKVTGESIADVGALFEKLERKAGVFDSNSKAVATNGKAIASEIKHLLAELEVFVQNAAHHSQKLRAETRQFQATELEALTAQSQRVDQQLKRLQDALGTIQSHDQVSQKAIAAVKDILKETEVNVRNGLKTWSANLADSSDALCKEMEGTGAAAFAAMEKALATMWSLMESVTHETRDHIKSEGKLAMDAKSLSASTVDAEIAHLRQQNALLTQLLESERSQGERARDELVRQVSGLLGEFTAARDRGLRKVVEEVQRANDDGEKRMAEFGEMHGSRMDGIVGRGVDFSKVLERKGKEGKKATAATSKAASAAQSNFAGHLSQLQGSISGSLTSHVGEVQSQIQTMVTTSTNAFERHGRAKRARVEATSAMGADIQSDCHYLQDGLASTLKNLEGTVGRVTSENSSLSTMTDSYHKATSARLSSIKHTTRSLIEQGAKEDVPTGKTPRKRVWEYSDEWDLTRGRDTLIRSWRERGASNVRGEAFLSSHLPPPDEGAPALGRVRGAAPRTSLGCDNDENVVDKSSSPPHSQGLPTKEAEVSTSSGSSLAASLASSSSSSSAIPLPTRPAAEHTKPNGSKWSTPPVAALVERQNIALTRRTRRVR